MKAFHIRDRSEAARFWEHVDQRGPDECWPWKGAGNRWGYGMCGYAGKQSNASRVAYIMIHGDIADRKLVVCHSCDNPICCNPIHLWLGTAGDNIRDCNAKKRRPYLTGAAHHRTTAKFSDDQVREMRRLHLEDGISKSEIGRRVGTDSSTVSKIVRGMSYGHVT